MSQKIYLETQFSLKRKNVYLYFNGKRVRTKKFLWRTKNKMMNFKNYNKINLLMREYFQKKRGFIEVPCQSKLSILAACEDPRTISKFEFGGKDYPLPQTGQMVLEEVLLNNPDVKGVFCITTSYRNEPNPIKGRHDLVFPMFEFESKGDIEELKKTERELLEHLGFDEPICLNYDKMCKKYNAKVLEAEHEIKMQEDYGDSISLEIFPSRSHPFWNMKYFGNKLFAKADVLLQGMETIGSAERSCNPEEMKYFFENVSNGEYKNLLFQKFSEKRVREELNCYLALPMIPRYGAGMGFTRMERAMKLEGLFEEKEKMILEEV